MEVSTYTFWENHSYELLEKYRYLQVAPSLTSIERKYCEFISGKTLHLFCNFGVNTFELEKFSDSITGLDFSDSAIQYALEFRNIIKSKAQFICSDFFNFDDDKFDTIYASYGILDWVEDLDVFFNKIRSILNPGGKFILVEFEQEFFKTFLSEVGEKVDEFSYLVSTNLSKDDSKTILGGTNRIQIKTKVYIHQMNSILSALDNSGLTLDRFDEYDYINFRMTNSDIRLDKKAFRHPKLPIGAKMCYGLVASL